MRVNYIYKTKYLNEKKHSIFKGDIMLKFNKNLLLSISKNIFFPTTSEALLTKDKKSTGNAKL